MLARYRSFEDVLLDTEHLCARLDGATVETYGESVQGRPLRAAIVPGKDERVTLLIAGMHGLEVIGPAVALRFLQRITEATPERTIVVVPVSNPDGYVRCWESGGAASYASMRHNARGVDLNRNFPLPRGATHSRLPYAGSSRPGAVAYRGPHPLSEPESRALAEWIRPLRPQAALSLHSFGGALIHPPAPDHATWSSYGALARAFREGSGRASYRRVGSRWGDVFTGELEDWLHFDLGCWASCVELHPWWDSLRDGVRAATWAERFNPREPERRVDEMTDGVAAWFAHARELTPLSPSIKSSVT